MTNQRLDALRGRLPQLNPLFCCLFAMGCLEFLLMSCGLSVYYLHKNNVIIPALMFFGAAFMTKLTPSAKRKLFLGILAVAWFLIVQDHRNNLGWKIHPYSWFLSTYLMAYPFAAVTQDGEKNKGLKLYAVFFLLASTVLIGYGILLLLGRVPEEYTSTIYFHEGSRFALMWNPNITGCIFMIAVFFCYAFFCQAEKRWTKYLFLTMGILAFITLTLTNSRTVVLITCAIAGGVVFFHIFSDGWKRFLIGLLTACIVIVGLFFTTEKLYTFHKDMLLAKYTRQLEEITEPAASVPDTFAFTTEEASTDTHAVSSALGLPASIQFFPKSVHLAAKTDEELSAELNNEIAVINLYKERRTFSNHLGSLNGRTEIWRAALRVIQDDPSVLIWGTEHVGESISLYTSKYFSHSHNSWVEILLSLGVPGLLTALVFSWIAFWNSMVILWNRTVPLWKKSIALLALGLLLAGFLEPYLFFSNQFYHFIDFAFFLCLGYLSVWAEALPKKTKTNAHP